MKADGGAVPRDVVEQMAGALRTVTWLRALDGIMAPPREVVLLAVEQAEQALAALAKARGESATGGME